MNNKAILEGLLFVVGDDGLTLDQITEIIGIDEEAAKELLLSLRSDYEKDDRGLRISFFGNASKISTKVEHKEYYQKLIEEERYSELSQSALEILAIIAYNEPATRVQVETIRGVSSSQMLRKLVAKGFLIEVGRAEMPGRPILYKTTNEFLDYFGLYSKEDLPKINIQEDEVVDEETDLFSSKYKEAE